MTHALALIEARRVETPAAPREARKQVPGFKTNHPRGHIMTDIESLVARLEMIIGTQFTPIETELVNEAIAAIRTLQTEKAELREALDAMCGFAMNVRIDLETGGAKATAIKRLGDMVEYVKPALSNTGEME